MDDSNASIQQNNVDFGDASVSQEGRQLSSNISQKDSINALAETLQTGANNRVLISQVSGGVGVSKVVVDQSGVSNGADIYQFNDTAQTDEIYLTQNGARNHVYADQWNDDGLGTGAGHIDIIQGGENNGLRIHHHDSNSAVVVYRQSGDDNIAELSQNDVTNSEFNVDVAENNNKLSIQQFYSSNDLASISVLGSGNSVLTHQGDSENTSNSSVINYTVEGDNHNAEIAQFGSNHNYTSNQNGDNGNVKVCQGSSSNCPTI